MKKDLRLICGSLHDTEIMLTNLKHSASGDDEYLAQTDSNLRGETLANITLAFRHLEDARMRLGKAIQALDGGVWVY